MHAELQHLNLETTTAADVRAREPQFRRWLAARAIPAERLQPAAERVVAALLSALDDPKARWILKRGYQDDFREHALSGYSQGELIHAVFDRSFVDAGVRWVIDYKTSQHLGGGLAEFLDREVERYGPQMRRYAQLGAKAGAGAGHAGVVFPPDEGLEGVGGLTGIEYWIYKQSLEFQAIRGLYDRVCHVGDE